MIGVYITFTALTDGTVSLLKDIMFGILTPLVSLLNLKLDPLVLSNK